MDKLLSFTPEPFPELDREAEDYELDPLAGEWEAEDAEEERGKLSRSRMSRMSPRRYLKKPTVRPRIQGRATGPRVKPLRRFPKLIARPLPVPALRPVPIPFIPPLWRPRPDLEPTTPRDAQRLEEPRRPEQAGSEGSGTPPSAQPSEEPASEHVRWVQECLNRALGLQLAVDGIMNRETRSAVRAFQERKGLAITGLVGPETETALQSMCAGAPSQDNATMPVSGEEWETPHPARCTCPSCRGRAVADHESALKPEPIKRPMEFDGFQTKEVKELTFRTYTPSVVQPLPSFVQPIPAYTPRVLTYSQKDVIDKRISVPAQHSLVRLSKNPTTSADAVGMLEEVKAGRLAGIYCVNWQLPAKRAERLGKTWWTVIPEGEDAVLMVDPDELWGGKPMMAFRRRLDPDCGLLRSETRFAATPSKLDAALLRVWQTYLLFRKGKIDCFPLDTREQYLPQGGRNAQPRIGATNLVCGPSSLYTLLNEPQPLAEHEDWVLIRFLMPLYAEGKLIVDEVRQGEISDCPLLAILAAMVHTGRYDERVISQVQSCVMSLRKLPNARPLPPSQKYACSNPGLLWDECRTNRYFGVTFRTQPSKPVTVSDLLYSPGPPSTPHIRYAHSSRGSLWVSIMEKAYARFRSQGLYDNSYGYGGRYGALEWPGSSILVDDYMRDLCGLEYLLDIKQRRVFRFSQSGRSTPQNVEFDGFLVRTLSRAHITPTIACTDIHVWAVLGMSGREVKLYNARGGKRENVSIADFHRGFRFVYSAP